MEANDWCSIYVIRLTDQVPGLIWFESTLFYQKLEIQTAHTYFSCSWVEFSVEDCRMEQGIYYNSLEFG